MNVNGSSWINSGNFGIGNTNPLYKLDVSGPGTSNGVTLRLNDVVSGGNSRHILITRSTAEASIGIAGSQVNDPLWITRSGGYDLMVSSAGYVGIGTTTPDTALHVNAQGEYAARFTGIQDSAIIIGGNIPASNGTTRSGEQYIAFQNQTTGGNAWMLGMDDDEIFTVQYNTLGEINRSAGMPAGLRISQDNTQIMWGDTAGDKIFVNDGYLVIRDETTAPSSPVNGQLWYDSSGSNLKIYNSSASVWMSISGPDGLSPGSALPSYSTITSYIGTSFGDGAYYINTPDGAIQRSYLIYAEGYVWVLVGRFAADASDTIQQTIPSARGMVDVSQAGPSYWNADWGSATVQDVMVWSADNFPARTGTGINFVYQLGGSHTLRGFLSGVGSGDNTVNSNYPIDARAGSHSSVKNSFYCTNGARDGVFKGSRWTNSSYRYMLLSDYTTAVYTNPYGLSNPLSSTSYWDAADDAKLSVAHSGDTSGQDYGNNTAYVGYDDGTRGFFDVYPSTLGNNPTTLSYSHACTIWARF